MRLRAAKEHELLENDPAISAAAPASPPFFTSQSHHTSVSVTSRTKPKVRQSLPAQLNGKETNGTPTPSGPSTPATGDLSASAQPASSRSRHRDTRGRWSNGPSANGSHEGTPSSTATAPASVATTAAAAPPRTGTRAGSARIRNRSTRAREAAEAAQSQSHGGRGAHGHTNGAVAHHGE